MGVEPEPNLTDRAHFSELIKDALNGLGDGLIRMEADFTILFAPDKTDRKTPAQLSPGRLIANASFETGAYHVQFGLCHGAFQPEQQPIIEEPGMVESVLITY